MRCRSAGPRRDLRPCASAAAWVWRCASPATEYREEGEEIMSRIAVVTGGTRGIGEAISKALKQDGFTVIATYAGNDDAAAKFKAETGVETRKWDVSDYDACAAGLKAVEADI